MSFSCDKCKLNFDEKPTFTTTCPICKDRLQIGTNSSYKEYNPDGDPCEHDWVEGKCSKCGFVQADSDKPYQSVNGIEFCGALDVEQGRACKREAKYEGYDGGVFCVKHKPTGKVYLIKKKVVE